MNARSHMWIMAGATLALALAALALLAPPAAATNDPDVSGGAVYGDWTVTDTRSYDSVTIWLESGNLSVEAGGSLTLTNVRLRFNNTEDGNYSLNVAAGGALNVYDGTLLSSNWSNIHYRFVVRGTLDMNNASASEMWGDNASWAGGIQIYSDSVTINNSMIYNGMTGGISIFDCSPRITNCTVRDNGQHGGSPIYCFGIYVRGSKAVIDNNNVVSNIYKVVNSERITYQFSKSGSGVFYNGENYYGWYYYGYVNGYSTYYCYRYEYNYTYLYGDYQYYGVGIWMENSTITMNANYIAQNGWGKSDGSYSYQYASYWPLYIETNGPYGSSYRYWYCAYIYTYKYNYIKVKCYGEGLHVEKSTLTLEKNTFNLNGFQDRHDFYPNTDSVGWYSGVDVNLYDCTAGIYNNTINNAATLLNLTRCTVTISGNKLLGDYIGVGATYYSANFIPSRVGYGIRYFQSKGDILNNTIEIKFKDYPVTLGGQTTYFADLVTAVDFPGAKDTTFSGNKVTIDSQYYGVCRALLFNTSLKATNLKILNCQFEFKYSGSVSTGKPTMPLVIISLKSESYIDNCTFKAPSGGSYSPVCYGVVASYGTTLTVVNSTFSNHHRALVVTDFSTLRASGVTVTGAQEAGIYLESLSKAELTSCKMTGTARGIMASKSTIDIHKCVLSNSVEFYMERAANINVYNTPHVKASAIALDNESWLNVSWPVTLNVLWQNGEPVPGAQVDISTMAGMPVYQGTTNDLGYPAEVLWIKEYVVHMMNYQKYNPHRITVSKGRASSLDLYIIDKALSIEFRLTDNVPPDLSVAYPFDMQRLNVSMVTFAGMASDPESGLVDAVVEINIDNTGWVQVPVDETFRTWSYTRPLSDGLHVVRIKANDVAGNVARESMSVYVDTTGPVLQVFSPTEGCHTNQRTVTVMGITEEGVFVTVNGIIVDLNRRSFSKPISLDVGPNVITVVASDSAGNARMVQVHVTFDTQPPILEIRSPRNGESTNQDPISVLGSTEPGTIIKVNGVRTPLVGSAFEALVGMSEGANTVSVTALDLAGNLATQTLTVYLDTAAPSVSLFSPRDGLWTNQSKVLVNGATEQGAVVTVNGQNTNVLATIFSGYVGLLEGANRIEVVARDQAGNSIALARMVYLDTRRPDLVVTSPADRSVPGTRVISVVGSVDFGAEVRVNGELVQVNDFVFSTTITYPEDGIHVVEVSAQDAAGNLALVTRTVTVDTTTPTILLSYPLDGMKVKQRLVTVSGQTEPFATVIVNTETMLVTGRDGLFQAPVVVEDGDNRITVSATDAAGNTRTESVNIMRPVAKVAAVEDLSWALNLTGLLLGIGIALPIMSYAVTASQRRRREGVLAELEAADRARKEKVAEEARMAALPRVEKMGKKRVRPVEQPKQEKAPEVLPEAPKAEAAAPDVAKTGLKDKSGATEVSPDEIDQETRMKAKGEEPSEGKKPAKAEEPESSLKDKGGEAEREAGETEVREKK